MNLSKIIYNWCFCIQKIGLLVKKISEIREICVSPRKAKRDPCVKRLIFPPGVPRRRQRYLLHGL